MTGLHGIDSDEQPVKNEIIDEASIALEVLGFSRKQTNKIISKIIVEHPSINVESLIKKVLNKL